MSDMHPHGEVRSEVVEDRVLVLTVDRTAKKNAFTPKIINELAVGLTRLDEDPELFVGVLTFAGGHTTAGLDMPLFFGPDGQLGAPAELVDPFGLGRRCRKPVVTAVQGITFTAGIEVSLAGDIVVAASDAVFSQLEPRRGLAALGGAPMRFVQRAGWGNAMYHLLRADEFDATEAYRIGLVQEVVDPGTQVERAIQIGREIAACAPLGVQRTIANARLLLEAGESAAAEDVPGMARELMATEDLQEGIASFIERRDARFSGR